MLELKTTYVQYVTVFERNQTWDSKQVIRKGKAWSKYPVRVSARE
jgi:hypothetical protein